MMAIESTAEFIGIVIGVLGALFLLSCLIDMIRWATAKCVQGTIIDCVQEFTSRGFLWRAKVAYMHNERQCFYVMRARSRKRGSGDVALRVTKRGHVVETNHMIEKCIFGVVAIIVAIMLVNLIGQQ